MQVLERATTPDGTKIQVESWKENYNHIKTLTIAVYPRAKVTGTGHFSPQRGEEFRADIQDFSNDEAVYVLFNELKEGNPTVEEVKNRLRSTHNLKEIF